MGVNFYEVGTSGDGIGKSEAVRVEGGEYPAFFGSGDERFVEESRGGVRGTAAAGKPARERRKGREEGIEFVEHPGGERRGRLEEGGDFRV